MTTVQLRHRRPFPSHRPGRSRSSGSQVLFSLPTAASRPQHGRPSERKSALQLDHESDPGTKHIQLAVDTPDGTGFDDLLGHSITYRVALGPHQGRKAFTLQTVPAAPDTSDGKLARAAGFSLHAGVACEGMSARSWNACAAISRGRSRPNGCR